MPWEGEWLEYAKCSKSISRNFYTHWYFRNGPDLSLTALELLMCTTPTCGLKHNSRCGKGCGRSTFSNRLFSDSPVSFVKFFEGRLFELVVCSITPTFLRDCSLTSMSVPVSMLLNTDLPVESELPNTIDVRHLITSVSELLSCPSLRAPPHIAEHLLDVVNYFISDDYPIERSTHTQTDIPPQKRQPLPLDPSENSASPSNTQYNIKLNRKTILSTLYTYDHNNVYIEYPDTDPNHPVGYLFCCNPYDWQNPIRTFAYSLRKLAGQSKVGGEVFSDLLEGKDGNCVPCVESHFTYNYTFILFIFNTTSELSQ